MPTVSHEESKKAMENPALGRSMDCSYCVTRQNASLLVTIFIGMGQMFTTNFELQSPRTDLGTCGPCRSRQYATPWGRQRPELYLPSKPQSRPK